MRINTITLTNFEEDRVDPIIQVKMGNNQVPANALADSGAQGKIISLSLYNKLAHMELQQTNQEIKSYTGYKTQTQGFAIIPVQIGSQSYPHKFYVVNDN